MPVVSEASKVQSCDEIESDEDSRYPTDFTAMRLLTCQPIREKLPLEFLWFWRRIDQLRGHERERE